MSFVVHTQSACVRCEEHCVGSFPWSSIFWLIRLRNLVVLGNATLCSSSEVVLRLTLTSLEGATVSTPDSQASPDGKCMTSSTMCPARSQKIALVLARTGESSRCWSLVRTIAAALSDVREHLVLFLSLVPVAVPCSLQRDSHFPHACAAMPCSSLLAGDKKRTTDHSATSFTTAFCGRHQRHQQRQQQRRRLDMATLERRLRAKLLRA